ncbi:hypothetical protein KP79_PYT06929 [Mizuhopecten yessoensis]|uniref:Uncharacterized protein n=1 Tax=Mizuhopecten yessoensis TaxID=6573 RepID=A0A210Q7H6_MIZYE|nr:hypothetical protein KP79_PYT06929 [Mizuhopecten yessoensis]
MARGRFPAESPWGWLKPSIKKCKANDIGWCVCDSTSTLIPCDRCGIKSNPECYGIARQFYTAQGKKTYICCGDVSTILKECIARRVPVHNSTNE